MSPSRDVGRGRRQNKEIAVTLATAAPTVARWRLRFLQRDPHRESLAGVERHLLRHRLVALEGDLQLVLAGRDFGGQGRLA